VLREMVFGQDGRFGYEGLIDRANSDLASGLGNLSSRTLTMIANYRAGQIPSGVIPDDKLLLAKRVGVDTDETTLAGFIETARDQFLEHFENLAFSRALETAWTIIARVDKMISDAKPWDLAKDQNQHQTLDAVLYRAAESLRWLSVLLYPVMPDSSRLLWSRLGFPDESKPDNVDPSTLRWGELPVGAQTSGSKRISGDTKSAIMATAQLFPRLDKKKKLSEIIQSQGVHMTEADAVPGAAPETEPEPPMTHATEADAVGITSFIELDDFAKVELRVGQVLSAERIPKADKLLLMKVDIGEEQPRQILAGIAQYYEPEKLVGRKVVIVANLKPRKLRGFESQGMVVAASYGEEGRPVIATFTEDVPNGARLK